MLSIQKILERDGKFYDLPEASAQQADASAHHLVRSWKNRNRMKRLRI
jgi:hypothetical protein